MSSTISVRSRSELSVTETFSGAEAGDPTATFAPQNTDVVLTASTSVPVTKHAEYDLAMSSGTASINLAALPGKTVDETIVGTGLKLQKLIVKNKSTNANKITVAKGASNGYGLSSAGDTWSIVLNPSQSARFDLDEGGPDVASGERLIDVTGTGSQVLSVQAVLG